MSEAVLARGVGIALAILFALVMGVSIAAVLLADFMQPGKLMSEPARQTLIVCGVAGALAGAVSWLLQSYAAGRGFVVRFLYAFGIFVLLFGAFGGLLEVVRKLASSPGAIDVSPTGLYWSSLGGFYTFLLFLLIPLRPALFGLWLAAALILALVGPREDASTSG